MQGLVVTETSLLVTLHVFVEVSPFVVQLPVEISKPLYKTDWKLSIPSKLAPFIG
jgi:hypothetical protein